MKEPTLKELAEKLSWLLGADLQQGLGSLCNGKAANVWGF